MSPEPKSPCAFPKVPRGDAFTVKATLAGYEPGEAKVESKLSGGGTTGMVGNVLAGGMIGVLIDGNNGSTHDLTPNPLKITLKALAVATPVVSNAAAPEATILSTSAPASAPTVVTATATPAVATPAVATPVVAAKTAVVPAVTTATPVTAAVKPIAATSATPATAPVLQK